MTHYNQAQSSVNELEESIDKYLTLIASTHQDNIAINETDEDNQDSLQQMPATNIVPSSTTLEG